ncbi:MAG: carboxypeptidase regulatory-like domain-containing protein [Verrucomicrobia bacterium]|nr:carboxypeptidase regulatory-like domain-containing protein [Verrucomicrobiota bacterium]
MKKLFACGLCGLAAVVSCAAGDITGTVRAEGKPGTEQSAGGGSYESRKFKFVERVNYAELQDFIVFIEGPVGDQPVVLPSKPLTVETRRSVSQKGAVFEPHVLPVVVGTTVEWPNNDEIYHNVFSMSETKPFDLDLYKAPTVKSVTFDKPGRVDVFCSIHSRMSCIVLVLENPYYAAADSGGHFAITNVPPGTYKLKAWHERVPAQVKEITVPAQGEAKVDFVLGINNLPKY